VHPGRALFGTKKPYWLKFNLFIFSKIINNDNFAIYVFLGLLVLGKKWIFDKNLDSSEKIGFFRKNLNFAKNLDFDKNVDF